MIAITILTIITIIYLFTKANIIKETFDCLANILATNALIALLVMGANHYHLLPNILFSPAIIWAILVLVHLLMLRFSSDLYAEAAQSFLKPLLSGSSQLNKIYRYGLTRATSFLIGIYAFVPLKDMPMILEWLRL